MSLPFEMSDKSTVPIEIGLTAAIVAIEANQPMILTASGDGGGSLAGLPSGPFDAITHRTLEIGLRAWVEEQTGLRLGYVEQLYTFGDRGRHARLGDTEVHVASIGYLALTRAADNAARAAGATFEPWYRFFPWEDWREQQPAIIARDIIPELTAWAAQAEEPGMARALARRDRVRLFFGM
ncbi:NAD regulator, partial [Rhodopseudomonas sp. BR0C11]|nr:NAD regulator [Rhodopseudomonas sp. BR0C11]